MRWNQVIKIGEINIGLPKLRINNSISQRFGKVIHWFGSRTLDASSATARNTLCTNLKKISIDLNEIKSQILLSGDKIATMPNQADITNQLSCQKAIESVTLSAKIAKIPHQIESQISPNKKNIPQLNNLSAQQNISKIVIGVAFHTNLTALNAEVEAVRGGWHGNVFSVVAKEVRHLAEIGTRVAADTSELIERSAHKTDVDDALIHQATEGLQEIIVRIEKLTELVTDLLDSNKGTRGIGETNTEKPSRWSVQEQQQKPAKQGRPHQHQLVGKRCIHNKG